MLRKSSLLGVVMAALIVLATTAPVAGAYRQLIIERGGAIRQVSENAGISFVGGIIIISCKLTLNGELRRGPFTEELPILAGLVTSLEWRECTGGEILALLNLPWQINIERLLERNGEARIAGIRPEAITGGLVSLGEKESEHLRPVGFRLELETIICLYGGSGENPSALLPLTRTGEREGRYSYSLGALTVLEAVRFRKFSGQEACPASGFIRGRFTAAEPGQTAIFQ
jgi:hypothetical protein